jgi:hypothetical protein
VRPEREFTGQRFVRYDASAATWGAWRRTGFECRDTGIGAATNGLAGARVVRPCTPISDHPASQEGELCFGFVLSGEATLDVDGAGAHELHPGDAFAIPPHTRHRFARCSDEFEFLDVTLPAEPAPVKV